jgi:hypothetical protein
MPLVSTGPQSAAGSHTQIKPSPQWSSWAHGEPSWAARAITAAGRLIMAVPPGPPTTSMTW